jgi:hypothetical protein
MIRKGWGIQYAWDRPESMQTLWMKNTKVRNNLEDPGVYRKIIFI